jgi:pyruvate dehydrogenase E1 component beta subunit|tara:strand:- start:536 stop:1513 length:978 start_codon:yes stop_codon:yes gene_type:complete
MVQILYREALRLGIDEALAKDPNVFIMGEDIGAYGGAYAVTDGLLDKYGPDRVKDTPISEATFIGAGVGAAMAGLIPIVELMSISFSLVAFDQIVNMAANIRYMSGGQINVPMVLRAPTGAGVQLAATHSQSFETWLSEVPGLKCVCPSTPYDALGLLRSALKDMNPVFIAEPAMLYTKKGNIPDDYYEIEIGKANIVKSGMDVSLISYGHGMDVIKETSEILTSRGLDPEIIDLRSLNPIDEDTIINSINKTNRVILVDTSRKTGGIMAEVASIITDKASDWLDGPIVRIGSSDVPWPYNRNLEKKAFIDSVSVIEAFDKAYSL